MTKKMFKAKAGSGPPFTVMMEVTVQCPGTRRCSMCNGSDQRINNLRAEAEAEADDAWAGMSLSSENPLDWCASYHCPFHRSRERRVRYKVLKVESLHLEEETDG